MATFFDHCVIDETHFYSNQYGLPYQLAKAIVSNCKYRLGLTGTPVGRDPYAIWAQASLIDDGLRFGYQYQFFAEAFGKRQKFPFTKSGYRLVFDPKKMDIFQYKLDSVSLSYGKGEVRSAEVYENKVRLKMHGEQKQAYNDAVRKLIRSKAGDAHEIDAIFTRLRMISSGYLPFVDEEGKQQTIHYNSVKLEWLREFATEVSPNTPCLIFHEYVHTGELICKVLTDAKLPHAWIHGETKDKAGEIAKFQSGKARFLVANTATGGTSIDLPQADYLLFFESPCDPRVRAQAAARPMARALDRLLILDDLICSPVEEKVLSFIEEGENLLKTLLAGGKKTAKELFA